MKPGNFHKDDAGQKPQNRLSKIYKENHTSRDL